jgi:hypothetical protein
VCGREDGVTFSIMPRWLLIAALSSAALAGDVDSAIRTTFIKPWMEAVQSKDPAKVKRFFHPKVLACLNDQTREYFEHSFAQEVRHDIKGGYRVTRIAPLDTPPSWPADSFTYPVQPTHEIQVEFGETVLIRYLAAANGTWYEVDPCPTEKGVALVHEQIVKGAEQRKHATQLAAELKDPLLTEVKSLLGRGQLIDAVKKYQAGTGTDLTTSRMVIEILRQRR